MDSNLIFTGLTLLATVFSAWAAWQSAKSARQAQDHSRDAEYRVAYREAALAAVECGLMLERIRELKQKLKGALRSSQVARGVAEDSYTDLKGKEIERRIASAEALASDVHTFHPPDLAKKALDLTSAHRVSVDLAAKSRALKDTEDWLTAELVGIQKVMTDALDSRRKL